MFSSTSGIGSTVGLGPTPAGASVFSNGSSIGAAQVAYGDSAGKITSAAGFATIGTPSATAPSTGTSGPGLLPGIVMQGADGTGHGYVLSNFGNGSTISSPGLMAFVSQGTAASPAATAAADGTRWTLRGHNGTNFTANAGAFIEMVAGSTWSGTNQEAYTQFRTCPNGATNVTVAGRIDPNQTLVWGGAFNSVSTFTGGTQRPHIQTAAATAANANMAQSIWINSTVGATQIMAKSRSTTVGTQGVITTGDTLGTLSWQGDDGTNFVASSQIVGACEGTIATGQVPGRLKISTANSAGTLAIGYSMDSQQVSLFHNGGTLMGSTLYSGGTVTPRVQVIGNSTTTAASPTLALAQFTAAATGGTLFFGKARSATPGTMTLVNASDVLGTVDFQGADGTNFVSGAQIVATATGTPASTRMGSSLVLKTATDAAPSVMTAAVTIDNAQGVTTAAARVIRGRSVVSAAATTTLDATDHYAVCTGSTTQTFTLAACATGRILYIKNRSSGNLTVARAGSDTIDGSASSTVLTANQSVTLIGNGTDWTVN